MSSRLHRAIQPLASSFAILLVASSIIAFNGGIAIGSGNHVGLLPVVRRILNPEYLPGDFNIELRLYHHRVFAWLIARLSIVFGEDGALIAIHLVSVLALSAALFFLCRTLKLSAVEFLLAGLLLSVNAFWIGLGLEENNFVGNPEIQPPTLAHAFVLAGTAALINKRWRLAALAAGLTTLAHLQIGVIFVSLIAPFYIWRLKQFDWRTLLAIVVAYLVPAAPAIWNMVHLLERGVSGTSFSFDCIRFRMPHHFELASTAAGVWFGLHLLVIILGYIWLRRADRDQGAIGVFVMMSLVLTGLIFVHFFDYYVLHLLTAAKFQFLRLSPLIGVFAILTLLTCLRVSRQSNLIWIPRVAVVILLAAGGWAASGLIRQAPDRFSLNVHRYAEQRSNWGEVCRWVRANGPAEAVYLAPPGRYGFTYLTDRSSVVEFKINPDGGQYLPQWTERMRDLCGGSLPAGSGLENRRPIDRAFGSLSDDQLRALSAKYNARFAVLPRDSKVTFPALYENRDFRVVEIESPSGINR